MANVRIADENPGYHDKEEHGRWINTLVKLQRRHTWALKRDTLFQGNPGW